jgi:hypothetical protein
MSNNIFSRLNSSFQCPHITCTFSESKQIQNKIQNVFRRNHCHLMDATTCLPFLKCQILCINTLSYSYLSVYDTLRSYHALSSSTTVNLNPFYEDGNPTDSVVIS